VKKTRIVCTIGPTTNDRESLLKLYELGMNIVRLNGSHNSLQWHIDSIKTIRKTLPSVPILVDLPGRKIRTTKVDHVFEFKTGDQLLFTTNQKYSNKDKVVVNYSELHKDLHPGNIILADDGTLKFRVERIEDQDIYTSALCSGVLKSAKGINVPFVRVNTPLVSDRDIEIIKMCIEMGVEFVGVSFVESGEHLKEVIKHVENTSLNIISKIENQFGLDNLESILENSFGILVDRGDLSAETEVANISIKQKEILKRAKKLGKPVIIATEMLHTMIENPMPTKAEVNDVTNAVLDGASAVMMSGETAAGKYPFEACKVMSDIVIEAELYLKNNLTRETDILVKNIPNIIGHCVSELCYNLPITKVVCLTSSGYAASQISRYRMPQELIVVTDEESKQRAYNLYWGALCVRMDVKFKPDNSEQMISVLKELFKAKVLKISDVVVATAVRYPNPKALTKMNYLEVHNIADLVDVFGW
jgi:pyruvate kinase